MALFQCGMSTADGITIALAFLFLAFVLHFRVQNRERGRADSIWFFLFAFALALLRPPYQLIGLGILALPPVWRRGPSGKVFFAVFFGILSVPCLGRESRRSTALHPDAA